MKIERLGSTIWFRGFCVSRHRIFSLGGAGVSIAKQRFWQMAILTAAGTIGATCHADAALYYWQDYQPGFYQPVPPVQPSRQRARKHSTGKPRAAEKEIGGKPQGPLIIAISIDHQKVRVYDANGFFAESPVSTGMKGHPTPMGVFSIIQKHRLHHSNIYSNAPMPYMQRITWSGVAMHAGVLPGYPASHGCIRMPTAFAIKMWNWTKMGARVIIAPGEMTPANFSHPLLVARKVVPQPIIADEPKTDAPAVKSDKGADAGLAIKPANSEANLELRPTVGHAGPMPLREQARTADARSAVAATNAAVTMSDAAPSKSQQAAADDTNSAEAGESVKAEDKTAKAKVEGKPVEVNSDEVKTGALKADGSKAAEKRAEPIRAVADAPDAKKDPSRLPGAEKAAAAKTEPPKRTGQISVLVSRKDGKLYARQNFAPLFEVPVTIAPSERMLGTHVFTAEADKSDPNKLRWSVVSLPITARNAARNEDDDYSSRRRKVAGGAPAEVKPVPGVNSPAEALDRITIPPDAMARIAEALTTGGSIIVSDQGINQGETGEGTDFIVSLR
jgi:lipoprotein-anchoring transpeptidase ErfK/SrfK